MEELKACPFCGGKAEITDHGGFYTVSCTNLDCAATIDLLEPSKETASADWNRRAAPENKPLTLEELRQKEGEPVYMVDLTGGTLWTRWTIFEKHYDNGFVPQGGGFFGADTYGKTWLAYARKPEGSASNGTSD